MAMREINLQGDDRFLGQRMGIQNAAAAAYSPEASTVTTATTGTGNDSMPPMTITDGSNNTTIAAAHAEAATSGVGASYVESGTTAASIIASMGTQSTGEIASVSASSTATSGYNEYGATEGGWDNPGTASTVSDTGNAYTNSTPAQQAAVDGLVSVLQNGGTDAYNPVSANVSPALKAVGDAYGDAITASSAINADVAAKGVTNVSASGDSDNNLTLNGPNQATGDGTTPIATTQVGVNSDMGGNNFGVNNPATWDNNSGSNGAAGADSAAAASGTAAGDAAGAASGAAVADSAGSGAAVAAGGDTSTAPVMADLGGFEIDLGLLDNIDPA